MRRTAVLLLAVAAVALPLSKSYDVVPYKNCIGTAPGGAQFGVSQYLRNTLDEITRVSVWIGDTFEGGTYSVEVKDSNTVVAGSYNVPAHKQWAWLDFDFDTNLVSPVRGKDYKVVVMRQGGAPISFAYCDTNPIAV
jgi:hypothetical protein